MEILFSHGSFLCCYGAKLCLGWTEVPAGAPVHSDWTPLQVLFSEGISNKMVPYGDISAFNRSQSIPPQTKLAKLSLEGAAYLHKENWYPSPTILSRIWGLRLVMKGNTQVPAKHPVLRPPGTDNCTHRKVAKQPWMLIGTANPGRVTLLRVIPLLWTTS